MCSPQAVRRSSFDATTRQRILSKLMPETGSLRGSYHTSDIFSTAPHSSALQIYLLYGKTKMSFVHSYVRSARTPTCGIFVFLRWRCPITLQIENPSHRPHRHSLRYLYFVTFAINPRTYRPHSEAYAIHPTQCSRRHMNNLPSYFPRIRLRPWLL